MAAQSLLAKLGMRLSTLGTVSSLAVAFPLSEGDPSMAAHTGASRIGLYADRTGGAEKMGHVVKGTEVLSVGVSVIAAAVKLTTLASAAVAGSGLNIGQGIAPNAPTDGDVWITSTGLFAQVAGVTAGPYGVGTIGGSIANTQVPIGSGVNTVGGSAQLTFASQMLIVGDGTNDSNVAVNGSSGSGSGLLFRDVGVARWWLRSNATTSLQLIAYNNAGTPIDSPMILGNAAGSPFTFTRELITPASTTATAGLNLPHGAAPTAPVNGDVWTTTLGMYARINGVTTGPFGSGGGATNQFSRVDWYTKNPSVLPTQSAGDFTLGSLFVPNRQVTITKIRFYWTAGNQTVNVKVWNATDGAAVVTGGSVVTSGVGWYVYTLPTPYQIPANRINILHYVSMRDNAGGIYVVSAGASAGTGVDHPICYSEPGVVFDAVSGYAAGDAKPTSTNSNERYPVEAVFDLTA